MRLGLKLGNEFLKKSINELKIYDEETAIDAFLNWCKFFDKNNLIHFKLEFIFSQTGYKLNSTDYLDFIDTIMLFPFVISNNKFNRISN